MMVLLPGCTCCGKCICKKGVLPYTMTVTPQLSGQVSEPEFIAATSCFGSGASLTAAGLWRPGEGYAINARIEPSLSVSGGSGNGVVFGQPVLSMHKEFECSECRVYWSIDSVTVSGNGVGYVDGESLKVTPGAGVQLTGAPDPNPPHFPAASLVLRVSKGKPTLVASVAGGGSGAEFDIHTEYAPEDEAWKIVSIDVLGGGSGYTHRSLVSFSGAAMPPLGWPSIPRPASVKILTRHDDPGATATVKSFAGTGKGAVIDVSLSPVTVNQATHYTPASVAISAAGSGYSVGDEISIVPSSGAVHGSAANVFSPVPHVSSVNQSGGITGVSFSPNSACTFSLDSGVVESVVIDYGGRYYSGVPASVEVQNGGQYYAEDTEAQPCVAEVTFTPQYSEGTSAGTVSVNRNDGTFGKVIDAPPIPLPGGWPGNPVSESCAGYPHEWWVNFRNGVPQVLVSANPVPLISFRVDSQYGSGAVMELGSGGPGRRTEPQNLRLGVGYRDDSQNSGQFAFPEYATMNLSLSKGTCPAPPNSSEDTYDCWRVSNFSASGRCAPPSQATNFQVLGDCVDFGLCAQITANEHGVITDSRVVNSADVYVPQPYSGQPEQINEVLVTNGGSGYAVYGREHPASVPFDPPGPWSPSFSQHSDEFGRPYWSCDSISVGSGSGFGDGQPLGVSLDEFEKCDSFNAVIRTQRDTPLVQARIKDGIGSGAALSVEMTGNNDDPATWSVSNVNVSSGGFGYYSGQTDVEFFTEWWNGNVTQETATATAVIGANGEVLSVTVSGGGRYYKTTDVPHKVEISNPGVFYRNNPSLTPLVSNVAVSVHQSSPSSGAGAVLVPVVDTDTSSETFGSIKRVFLQNRGSGYTHFASGGCLWEPPACDPFYSLGVWNGCSALFANQEVNLSNDPFQDSGRLFLSTPFGIFGAPFVGRIDDCDSFTSTLATNAATVGGFLIQKGGVAQTVQNCHCAGTPPSRPCPENTLPHYSLSGSATMTLNLPGTIELEQEQRFNAEQVSPGYCMTPRTVTAEVPLAFTGCTSNTFLSDTTPLGVLVDDVYFSAGVTCVNGQIIATFWFRVQCKLPSGGGYFSVTHPLEYSVNGIGFLVPQSGSWSDEFLVSRNQYYPGPPHVLTLDTTLNINQ